MKDTGLVLEGGGTRGVFTAGVLDYFMDQGLYFPYVIGVSAGSGNAISYVSKQRGRIKASMIDFLRTDTYFGFKKLIETGNLFDLDMMYDLFPNKLFPFDYETFFNSETRCLITTTNCHTGRAMYLEEKKDKQRLMAACKASCSVPVISRIVEVDGTPMMDGGIGDSIPIKKAMKDGYQKNVLILTRNKGYRKEPTRKENLLAKVTYNREYPWFVRSIVNRPSRYNRNLKKIERMEKEGEIFVIRPEMPVIKETDTDPDDMLAFYEHGYEVAKTIYDDLMKYLEK